MDVGLASPLEVYQSLAAEGFQLSYRRIPLSRERTPEAADLDTLHSQMQLQPEEGEGLLLQWCQGRRALTCVICAGAPGCEWRMLRQLISQHALLLGLCW